MKWNNRKTTPQVYPHLIRIDLILSGGGADADITTWHQAATDADMLQALVGSEYEAEATEIGENWIMEGLASYQGTKCTGEDGWKAKDSSVYLISRFPRPGQLTTRLMSFFKQMQFRPAYDSL